MKYLKTYEGIRDKMTPKSSEEILNALNKLSPYGMSNKIYRDGIDNTDVYTEVANKRMKEAETELDTYFENIHTVKLNNVVKKVVDWVEKNGGNSFNLTEYGFKSLADQIDIHSDINSYRHDAVVIYNKSVVESFGKLLKEFALCEVNNNNIDDEGLYNED